MELTPERLTAQLASEPLRPAYLIAGPETLRVLEAADAVRVQARVEGIGEREIFDADGRDFDWNQLAQSVNAPSLFASRRLLEVRLPSAKPGKDGSAFITEFCADPPHDVVLLITGEDWSRQHGGKWSETIARVGHHAIAWALKPHEMPDWIERRLRARGLRADRDAVERLVERVEGNLLAAAQEVEKLALLAPGKRLNVEQMETLVADSARYDVFKLIESALAGDTQRALRMVHSLRAEGEQVAGLLPIIAMELLKVAGLARIAGDGRNLANAMRDARIWDSKQALFRRAIARHPAALWESMVAEAGRIDLIAKGRLAGDPWLPLERLLAAIAETKARALLAT